MELLKTKKIKVHKVRDIGMYTVFYNVMEDRYIVSLTEEEYLKLLVNKK